MTNSLQLCSAYSLRHLPISLLHHDYQQSCFSTDVQESISYLYYRASLGTKSSTHEVRSLDLKKLLESQSYVLLYLINLIPTLVLKGLMVEMVTVEFRRGQQDDGPGVKETYYQA